MGRLSTHVLDTAHGRPAAGVAIDLYFLGGQSRQHLVRTTTNDDGRTDAPLLDSEDMVVGVFELVFHVGAYFAAQGVALPETRFLSSSREQAAERDLKRESRWEGFRRAFRDPALMRIVATTFLFYLAFAGMESTFALYSGRIFGWGGTQNGYYMTLIGVSMIVVQGFLVGRLVKRLREVVTLALGLVVTASGLFVLAEISLFAQLIGFELEVGAAPPLIVLMIYCLGGVLLAGFQADL